MRSLRVVQNIPGRIRVRTFERGVEGETLACGTGVTASALIASRVHKFGSPVKVQVQGGDELEVSFKEPFHVYGVLDTYQAVKAWRTALGLK